MLPLAVHKQTLADDVIDENSRVSGKVGCGMQPEFCSADT